MLWTERSGRDAKPEVVVDGRGFGWLVCDGDHGRVRDRGELDRDVVCLFFAAIRDCGGVLLRSSLEIGERGGGWGGTMWSTYGGAASAAPPAWVSVLLSGLARARLGLLKAKFACGALADSLRCLVLWNRV